MPDKNAESPKAAEENQEDRKSAAADSGAAEPVEAGAVNEEGTETDVQPGPKQEVEPEPVETESDRYLRLAAEFDNYKKRTAREFGEIVRTANARLLRSLVDIVDNFERALSSSVEEENSEGYKKGVELIYNQLVDMMAREQVSPIEAVGKPFDPNLHEAVMQVASDEYDEGIVCQEAQRGYTIADRVLRHARVVVSTGPETGDESEDKKDNDEK